jgi:hypothetical protein
METPVISNLTEQYETRKIRIIIMIRVIIIIMIRVIIVSCKHHTST